MKFDMPTPAARDRRLFCAAAGVKQQLEADALKRHGIEGAAVAPRVAGR